MSISPKEKREILSRCELFAGLTEDVLSEVASRCGERSFPSGSVLFRDGVAGDTIYLIVEGRVEIYKGSEAVSKTLAVLEPPDFFGEMAVLSEGIRSTSARSQTPLRVLFLKRKAVRWLVQTIPNVAFGFFRVLIRRLQQSNEYVLASGTRDHVLAVFHLLTGSQQGKSVRMLRDRLEFGRSSGEDLPDPTRHNLADSTNAVARRHAEVVHRNGTFFLRELEADHPTLLNGEPVIGTVALVNGDTFRLGPVTLRFQALQGAAAKHSSGLIGIGLPAFRK